MVPVDILSSRDGRACLPGFKLVPWAPSTLSYELAQRNFRNIVVEHVAVRANFWILCRVAVPWAIFCTDVNNRENPGPWQCFNIPKIGSVLTRRLESKHCIIKHRMLQNPYKSRQCKNHGFKTISIARLRGRSGVAEYTIFDSKQFSC